MLKQLTGETMNISLNWQTFAASKQISPLDLYSRVRVDGTKSSAAKADFTVATTSAQEYGPQKAVISILLHTLDDKLQALNREVGVKKDTQPLLSSVKSTINELKEIYGEPVADMAIGMLTQEIQKNGASELALSGTFDKLVTTLTKDESLLEKNKALTLKITGQDVEAGQWAGRGLLTMWNAGMNAVRDIYGNFENGEGEYWGGEDGLVLRNQSKKGIAHAMAAFYGSNVEKEDKATINKSTKVFMASGVGADTEVMRGSVEWLESKKPGVVQKLFVDDTTLDDMINPVKAENLQHEIGKAVKFLLEDIGDEQAAHMLQQGGPNFIDTALQTLNRVKTNKGDAAAHQAMNYFTNVFVEKINCSTAYGNTITKDYDSFNFAGFSDQVKDGADADKASSPFYVNWDYTDKSGQQGTVSVGLGENQIFSTGSLKPLDVSATQTEQQLQETVATIIEAASDDDDAQEEPATSSVNTEAEKYINAYFNASQKQAFAIFSATV